MTAPALKRELHIAATPGLGRNVAGSGSLEEMEQEAVLSALRRTHGNKKQAAEILGIHRPTLYAKMRRFGIGQ